VQHHLLRFREGVLLEHGIYRPFPSPFNIAINEEFRNIELRAPGWEAINQTLTDPFSV
jgi:hypothetical protein